MKLKVIEVITFLITSSVSSWFIIKPSEDLRGIFWELRDSEVSLASVAEGLCAYVLEDTRGSVSDSTPLGHGASITCAKTIQVMFEVKKKHLFIHLFF